MNKKIFIVKFIKWILRFIIFTFVAWRLIDYGMNIIYALISATVFMIFLMWIIWIDYKVNPIIRYDENEV